MTTITTSTTTTIIKSLEDLCISSIINCKDWSLFSFGSLPNDLLQKILYEVQLIENNHPFAHSCLHLQKLLNPTLEELYIQKQCPFEISGLFWKSISLRCPYLRLLKVDQGHHIDEYSLRNILRGCSMLSKLQILNNGEIENIIDPIPFNLNKGIALSNNSSPLNLTFLSISECKSVSGISLVTILFKSSSTLTHLDLSGCCQFDSEVLERIRWCTKLIHLNLAESDGMDDSVFVPISKSCTLLQRLNLSWCENITDQSIFSLCENVPRITDLKLRRLCNLTDVSIQLLAKKYGEQLNKLYIDRCDEITNIGLKQLVEFCTSLRKIRISWLYNITNEVVIEMLERFKYLEEVDLSGCKLLTNDALQNLNTAPSITSGCLKLMDLSWCNRFTNLESVLNQIPDSKIQILDYYNNIVKVVP